jgi:hypothetical protein
VAVLAVVALVVAAAQVVRPAEHRAAARVPARAGELAQEPVAVRRRNPVRVARAVARRNAPASVAPENAAPQARARNQRRRSQRKPARAQLLARVLAKKPLRQARRQQVRRSRTGQALARARVSVRDPARVNGPEPVQARPAADELRT